VEAHQKLSVFLPKLREGLRRKGIAAITIASYEFDITTRARPQPLKDQTDYQDAWIACHVAMDILTDDQDGSEAADWHNALCHRVFDYEDAFEARHGCRPLNPGGPEWTEGPTGRA
jgi:hypothetical protein